jgi:LEA14-like dessication related protein
MLKLIRRALLVIATLTTMLLLSGCNIISKDDFVFHGAKIISLNLTEGAQVEMVIENKSPFKVTIVGGELTAGCKGDIIGSVYMREPVVLPKKSTTTVTVNVGFKFSSPMAALRALQALTSSPDEITISGYGEGKIWFIHKRFERTNVPLSKFIAIFGTPSDYFN